jgi:hypothetical protein
VEDFKNLKMISGNTPISASEIINTPEKCITQIMHVIIFIKTGHLTNIAPNALNLVTPDYANPNFHVVITDDLKGKSDYMIPMNASN